MDEKDEMLIRHDERINKLEGDFRDLARITNEQGGRFEGWWQARRDSLIEDIRVDVEVRQLRAVKRLGWLAITAIVSSSAAIGLTLYMGI